MYVVCVKEKSSQSFDSLKTLRDEKNLWFVPCGAKEAV